MRRFILVRDDDETGISGTGVVCEGVEFLDGHVAMRWMAGEFRSTVVWEQGMTAVVAIHGHAGRTRVEWLDNDDSIDGYNTSPDDEIGKVRCHCGEVFPGGFGFTAHYEREHGQT